MASITTGVTLILGLFIYNNEYEEWIYIAGILIACLNAYFLFMMISRIVYGKIRMLI